MWSLVRPAFAEQVTMSRTPASYDVPPPDPGDYIVAVLKALGLSDDEASELARQGVIWTTSTSLKDPSS